jgi:probable F420-dependent oxidoreductase
MKFNVGLLNAAHVKALGQPAWERALTAADQARALRLADELGFWKASVCEHFAIPEAHFELSGDHYPQSTTALGFMAGVTSRMKLASGVTILPLLHPIVHAKMWATLDWLNGGRSVMMVGVGWLEAEFELLDVSFKERGAICDEYVAAILELWTKDVASFEGRYVKFRDIGSAPKPTQKPAIPIWFGGDALGVQKRVARWGSGWSPFQTPPDTIPERIDWIKSQPDYHGRPIEIVYSLNMLKIGESHAVRNAPQAAGVTDVNKLIDQIGYLKSLGVTETDVPRPPHRDFEEYLDWLRWIAAEIMPRAR